MNEATEKLDELMLFYESAPRGCKSGLPDMVYAWEVWLHCNDNEMQVPGIIQERVDLFCRMQAVAAVKTLDKIREEHALKAFSKVGVIEKIDELRSQGKTVEQACEDLSRRWEEYPDENWMSRGSTDAETIRQKYYRKK